MSAIAKARLEHPTAQRPQPGHSVVLHDVSWEQYETISRALEDRHVYLTYDEGVLEIMVVSGEHERYKSLFPYLLLVVAKFFRKKCECFGSFTHQREDQAKGLEPDQCFYIRSWSAVKGKKNIDLALDPPPDLAIEIDIKSSSMDRLGIYAALGIPEVWNFDGSTLRVLLLANGRYEAHDESGAFPGLIVKKLTRFLEIGVQEGQATMMETVEEWLSKPRNRRARG